MIRPTVPATRANSKSHVHWRFPLEASFFFFFFLRRTRGRWSACGFDALIEFNAVQFGPNALGQKGQSRATMAQRESGGDVRLCDWNRNRNAATDEPRIVDGG